MTKLPEEKAQYDPTLTEDQVREMEMACVAGAGVLIQDRCHKRTYYLEMDRDIGASDGELTRFIFVEYVNSGSVHGRPITRGELRTKGVR